MDQILLLTDFSELSSYAISLADKVAYYSGARLHILKVVDVPSEVQLDPQGELLGGMADDVSSLIEEKHTSEKHMEKWVSDLKSRYTS